MMCEIEKFNIIHKIIVHEEGSLYRIRFCKQIRKLFLGTTYFFETATHLTFAVVVFTVIFSVSEIQSRCPMEEFDVFYHQHQVRRNPT